MKEKQIRDRRILLQMGNRCTHRVPDGEGKEGGKRERERMF